MGVPLDNSGSHHPVARTLRTGIGASGMRHAGFV